jgi:hypothetical protein
MRVETVTFPAFLASALINGDTSGLEGADLQWLERAEEYVAPGRVVDCSDESFFCHRCDLPGFNLGADCVEFSVLYPD